jgi:hypothetical protein
MQHPQYASVREHDTRLAQGANPDPAPLAAAQALD